MKKYYIWIIPLFIMMSCATLHRTERESDLNKRQVEQLLINSLIFEGQRDNGLSSDSTFNAARVLLAIEDSLVKIGKLEKYNQMSYWQFSIGLKNADNKKIFLDIISHFDPYKKLDGPLICSVIPGNLYEFYIPQKKQYQSLTLLWNLLKSYIQDGSMTDIEDYKPYLENISDADFRKPIYRFPLLLNNFYLCYYYGDKL